MGVFYLLIIHLFSTLQKEFTKKMFQRGHDVYIYYLMCVCIICNVILICGQRIRSTQSSIHNNKNKKKGCLFMLFKRELIFLPSQECDS